MSTFGDMLKPLQVAWVLNAVGHIKGKNDGQRDVTC